MNRIFVLVFLVLSSKISWAQNCGEGIFTRPSKISPELWQVTFDCHKLRAEDSNSYSQAWLGYSYLGGYGTKPSMTRAVEWFQKATAGGNADAPYALAELVYFGHVKLDNYKDERELFRLAAVGTRELYAKDLLDTQRKMVLEYGKWPMPRYAASLMRPGMTESERKNALEFAFGFQTAILERKIIPRPYKINEVKAKLEIAEDSAPNGAVEELACIANRDSGISYSNIAAAIESYGVKIEDRFTQPCPPLHDRLGRLLAPAALPLHQLVLYKISPDAIGAGISDHSYLSSATSIAMYMVWSRGNHVGMNKIYRAKSTDGLTIGELLADRYLKAVNRAAKQEVEFRKAYNKIPRNIREKIIVKHGTDGTLDVAFPVALAKAETQGFETCVKNGKNYIDKFELARKLAAVLASPPTGMFDPTSDLQDCVSEPNYVEKLSRLEPYYDAYATLSRLKLDLRLKWEIDGLGNTLDELCEYEMIHNPRPPYCKVDQRDMSNRLNYWTDNLRSGYENTSIDQILRSSML